MQMREADDVAIRRARVFVDTPAALSEGGDVAQALEAGVIGKVRYRRRSRRARRRRARPRRREEITLFKSVGASIEDLAAAALIYKTAG